MQANDIKQLIETGLDDCEALVDGEDGTHFQAIIISPVFDDKSMLQQHQLVYQTLGGKMGTDIHALSMQTFTPEEWQKKQTFKVM